MNVVTISSGKQVKDSSEKSEEVKESESTPPENEVVEEEEKNEPPVSPLPYKPTIPFPFPQWFAKAKVEAKFKKFMELLKNLYINICFI